MSLNNENNIIKKIVAGRLYCIYNEMYDFYGEHVYKLGNSKDIECRLKNYTTSYIKPCIVKYKSDIFRNKSLAENILFEMLKEYRISNSREFFKCNFEIIKSKIEEIVRLFDKYNDNELENNYIIPKIKLSKEEKEKILKENKELLNKFLYMKSNEYNIEKIKILNNKNYKITYYNIIIQKLDGLFYLENLFNIKRFNISKIKKTTDIDKIKKTLLNNINKLYLFNNPDMSIKKREQRIITKINNIKYYDQLQKFIADCYNTFDDIITYTIIKTEKRNMYENFMKKNNSNKNIQYNNQ